MPAPMRCAPWRFRFRTFKSSTNRARALWSHARRAAAPTGDILVYLDADCRAPLTWLERVEQRFLRAPDLIALSGPYRYYDWDWWGRLLIRAYDFTLAPATQFLVKYLLRYLYTSARRYNAMGKGAVFRLYVRNFTSEVLQHRPRDTSHVDVRG